MSDEQPTVAVPLDEAEYIAEALKQSNYNVTYSILRDLIDAQVPKVGWHQVKPTNPDESNFPADSYVVRWFNGSTWSPRNHDGAAPRDRYKSVAYLGRGIS